MPKRNLVLSAAVKLFSETGFNHTNLSDIASLCGCTHAYIVHEFGSKDELYITAMIAIVTERLFRSPVYEHTKSASIDQLFDTLTHYNREHFYKRDFMRMFMYLILDNRKLSRLWHREHWNPLGRVVVTRFKKEQAKGNLRKDVRADSMMQGLSFAVMMRTLMESVFEDEELTDRHYDDFLKIWLRGCAP
jgi:AcrR family transcriptional regulator